MIRTANFTKMNLCKLARNIFKARMLSKLIIRCFSFVCALTVCSFSAIIEQTYLLTDDLRKYFLYLQTLFSPNRVIIVLNKLIITLDAVQLMLLPLICCFLPVYMNFPVNIKLNLFNVTWCHKNLELIYNLNPNRFWRCLRNLSQNWKRTYYWHVIICDVKQASFLLVVAL